MAADRRRSKKGLRRRLFPARQGFESDDLEITIDDRDRPWRHVAPDTLTHEPGDAYLLMEVINLLRFGGPRLAEFGLPAGTMLVGPHDDDVSAEALWANSLTDAQPRSPELDSSLERVLGVLARKVEERCDDPRFRDRKILVHVDISRDEARFVIRDEGKGFDVKAVPTTPEPGALVQEGGRGLVLMGTFMDEVRYNDVGNEVTMVKRRPAP